MREKLINLLNDIRPEIDFETESDFMNQGLLDSLDVATILSDICEEFDLDIGPDELKKDNFNTIDGMLAMIQRYSK